MSAAQGQARLQTVTPPGHDVGLGQPLMAHRVADAQERRHSDPPMHASPQSVAWSQVTSHRLPPVQVTAVVDDPAPSIEHWAPAMHVSDVSLAPVDAMVQIAPVHVRVEALVPVALTPQLVPTPQVVVSELVPRPSMLQRVPALMQSVTHVDPPVQVIVHGQPMPHMQVLVPVHIWTVG